MGQMVGLNSPFGLLGKIKIERGLTHKDLLWEENWINLLLENADQPRYSKETPSVIANGAEELKNILGR